MMVKFESLQMPFVSALEVTITENITAATTCKDEGHMFRAQISNGTLDNKPRQKRDSQKATCGVFLNLIIAKQCCEEIKLLCSNNCTKPGSSVFNSWMPIPLTVRFIWEKHPV